MNFLFLLLDRCLSYQKILVIYISTIVKYKYVKLDDFNVFCYEASDGA